jgi:hypothetical protein
VPWCSTDKGEPMAKLQIEDAVVGAGVEVSQTQPRPSPWIQAANLRRPSRMGVRGA